MTASGDGVAALLKEERLELAQIHNAILVVLKVRVDKRLRKAGSLHGLINTDLGRRRGCAKVAQVPAGIDGHLVDCFSSVVGILVLGGAQHHTLLVQVSCLC